MLQSTVRVTWPGGQLDAALADGHVTAQSDLLPAQPDISRVDFQDWLAQRGSTQLPEVIPLSQLRHEIISPDGTTEVREPSPLVLTP